MKKLNYLIVLVLLVAIDLGSKFVIEKTRFEFEIITNVLSIGFVENVDTCLKILDGDYSVLLVYAVKMIVLLTLIFIVSRVKGNNLVQWGLTLMLAGNLGNLINVLTYDGKAIDWIVLGNFVAINLADVYLLVGIGVIACQLITWLFTGCLTKKLLEIVRT